MDVSSWMVKSLISAAVAVLLSSHLLASDGTVRTEQETSGDQDAVITPATERELEADEDPLNRHRADAADAASKGVTSDLRIYGSARVRNRHGEAGNAAWEDFGSRLGVNGWSELAQSTWFFGRYELGFNLLEEFGFEDSLPQRPDLELGRTLYTRLMYVGIEKENLIIALGKNWSTYYQVGAFTDRFDSMGGEASGVYNALTDGGPSGTGRADQVLQARVTVDQLRRFNNLEPLAVNVQIQYGEPIPVVDGGRYGVGYGVSTILKAWKNLSIGVAYNHSGIDLESIDQEARNGLDGDMSAWLLGARWFDDDWYIGLTLSATRDLQIADNWQYFHGTGVELYGQRRVTPRIWVLAGLNRLHPDSHQPQVGFYELAYGVVGLRYAIKDFLRMLYLEGRIDRSRTHDNLKMGNQLVAGIRWGF